MFCPSCGKNLPNDSRFCDQCGMTITPAAPAAPAAPIAPAPSYNAYQQQYAPPSYQDERTRPLTTGNFMIMFLLSAIPLVGLIMQLVWAFDSGSNLNRKAFARAALIWTLIGIGVYILMIVIVGASFASFFSNFSDYMY